MIRHRKETLKLGNIIIFLPILLFVSYINGNLRAVTLTIYDDDVNDDYSTNLAARPPRSSPLFSVHGQREQEEQMLFTSKEVQKQMQPSYPSSRPFTISLPDNNNTQIFIRQCTPSDDTEVSSSDLGSLIESLSQEHVNMIRRELMMKHMECFQLHSDLFKRNFIQRLTFKHLMLHMPKAGGTTICKRARRETNPIHNCVLRKHFCPFWCCCPLRKKVSSCDELQEDAQDLEFIMNESRHTPGTFCEGFMYSALLREPVSRTISHIRHLKTMIGPNSFRFAFGQQNYQTWALSGGERQTLEIDETHILNMAKSQLASMDLIVDLGYQDMACIRKINMLLQIGNATNGDLGKKENVGKGLGQTGVETLNKTDFVLSNKLDMELYNFAKPLMDADCKFVQSLL
jgi:hypothetical protein